MATILPADLLARGWQTIHGNVEGLVPGNGSLDRKSVV